MSANRMRFFSKENAIPLLRYAQEFFAGAGILQEPLVSV